MGEAQRAGMLVRGSACQPLLLLTQRLKNNGE